MPPIDLIYSGMDTESDRLNGLSGRLIDTRNWPVQNSEQRSRNRLNLARSENCEFGRCEASRAHGRFYMVVVEFRLRGLVDPLAAL